MGCCKSNQLRYKKSEHTSKPVKTDVQDVTTSISAITVCKNRLNDLKRTLPRLVSCGFDEIVLVDYDCPQKCGDWVAAHYPEVKVVRHQGDEGFSAARAKNLGARRVTSDWILFIDADIEVDPESAGRMKRVLKNRYYYRAGVSPFHDPVVGRVSAP